MSQGSETENNQGKELQVQVKERLLDSDRFKALVAIIITQFLVFVIGLVWGGDQIPDEVMIFIQDFANKLTILVFGWMGLRTIRNVPASK